MPYPKLVPNPHPQTILAATCGCSTSLTWNEEVWLVHFGEDGAMPTTVITREMFIEQQVDWCCLRGDFLDEFMSLRYDGEEFDD